MGMSPPVTARRAGGRSSTVPVCTPSTRSSFCIVRTGSLLPARPDSPMVGLVIVTHSATLAAGVAELARGMGGEGPIELAGGIGAPEPALGTDAVRVSEAIERADKGDGVLVLMDLGSAVLSAEMALDLLPAERSARVLLSEAPLADVAAEARGALQAKVAHLGTSEAEAPVSAATDGGALTVRLAVRNPLGLHAR